MIETTFNDEELQNLSKLELYNLIKKLNNYIEYYNSNYKQCEYNESEAKRKCEKQTKVINQLKDSLEQTCVFEPTNLSLIGKIKFNIFEEEMKLEKLCLNYEKIHQQNQGDAQNYYIHDNLLNNALIKFGSK